MAYCAFSIEEICRRRNAILGLMAMIMIMGSVTEFRRGET